MRIVVSGIVVTDLGLLLCEKGNGWILPGGKLEEGESDEKCLRREFGEELGVEVVEVGEQVGEFFGKSPNQEQEICVRVYPVRTVGVPLPGREISAIGWMKDPEKFKLSEVTGEIVGELIRREYL